MSPVLHSGFLQNFCLFRLRESGLNKSSQFLHLRLRIFFFIDLIPPQIYDKSILKACGVCGIRRVKHATKKNAT